MGSSFREWPWPLQALVYLAGAFVLVLAGLYIPYSPVAGIRGQLEAAKAEEKPLESDVASLRVYEQRRSELQSEMDALNKQLATLQTIVPEDKQTDQFILMVEREALSSGVSIRHLSAGTVTPKAYYFEMPFTVDADGPYFSVLDFFGRLGRLSRIINIGDLKFSAIPVGGVGNNFHMTPGTSVNGTFTMTTFFTKSSGSQPAASAPAKR